MKKEVITTEKKIGKVTYFVSSTQSEQAKDTLDKKVEKMILKDVGQNAEISKLY